jgi:hypothetical protein
MTTKWTPLGRVAAVASDYHADVVRLAQSRSVLIGEVLAALDAGMPTDTVAKCAGVPLSTVYGWQKERP